MTNGDLSGEVWMVAEEDDRGGTAVFDSEEKARAFAKEVGDESLAVFSMKLNDTAEFKRISFRYRGSP